MHVVATYRSAPSTPEVVNGWRGWRAAPAGPITGRQSGASAVPAGKYSVRGDWVLPWLQLRPNPPSTARPRWYRGDGPVQGRCQIRQARLLNMLKQSPPREHLGTSWHDLYTFPHITQSILKGRCSFAEEAMLSGSEVWKRH